MAVMVLIIVLVVVLFVIIGMMVGLWYLVKLIRPDVPPNNPIIFSLDTLKTHGFCIGVLKEILRKTNNATHMSMKPLDLPYNSKGKPISQDNFDFAIRDEKKIELPPGSLSHFRSCIILLPEGSTSLNDEFRNTEFGMAISNLIELRNYKDKAIDIIANRQVGERTYLALLEDEQNKMVAMYKNQINEVTAQAKERALITTKSL